MNSQALHIPTPWLWGMLRHAPIKMELTQLLAAGNLMRQCLVKGNVCNDRQRQGTWCLAAGTSIIQTPVLLWPPTHASISWQDILLLVPRTYTPIIWLSSQLKEEWFGNFLFHHLAKKIEKKILCPVRYYPGVYGRIKALTVKNYG